MGVIGAGFIGAVHVEMLRRLGNVEVVAVSDLSNPLEKSEKLYIPKAYSDFREMIEAENLDSIHICTPNNQHFEQTMFALDHKIAVMCEKPLSVDLAQAQEITEKSTSTNTLCGINFMYRFFPLIRQMKETISLEKIGKIYSIHGSYLQDWLLYQSDYNWRLDPSISGKSRAFADIGSHLVDTIENVTGLKIMEVFADLAIFHPTRKKTNMLNSNTFESNRNDSDSFESIPIETEDYAAVLFRFDNGAHGSILISQTFAGRKNQVVLAVAGANGALHWNSDESNSLWMGKRHEANMEYVKDPSLLYSGAKSISSYPGGHNEGFADAITQNFKAFYRSLEHGGQPEGNLATCWDGLREMQISESVLKSAMIKQWVKI